MSAQDITKRRADETLQVVRKAYPGDVRAQLTMLALLVETGAPKRQNKHAFRASVPWEYIEAIRTLRAELTAQ